jgi:hypothetical protein
LFLFNTDYPASISMDTAFSIGFDDIGRNSPKTVESVEKAFSE